MPSPKLNLKIQNRTFTQKYDVAKQNLTLRIGQPNIIENTGIRLLAQRNGKTFVCCDIFTLYQPTKLSMVFF